MPSLFFYPSTLEILTRRISFNHPSHKLERYALEEFTFQNNGNDDIKEIILEIDDYKDNLKIEDESGINIIYLPNPEIITRGAGTGYINQNIIDKVNNDEIFLLWIILNKPLEPGDQQKLVMTYFKTPKLKSIVKPKSVFDQEEYPEKISFYKQETLTVHASWEDGLSIKGVHLESIKKDGKSFPLSKESIHYRQSKDWFQYSISSKIRAPNLIDYIYSVYYVEPEKSEKWLISTLLGFALFFPFTEILFIVFHLISISRLFYIIQVEVVIILTLTFAQLRTSLVNYKLYLTLSLIITASLVIIGLMYFLL